MAYTLEAAQQGTRSVVAYGLPAVSGDATILAAFAARCRDFSDNYERDLTPEQEDAYFARIDATERVISETPASTVGGVVAKLRVAFVHLSDSSWVDHALLGPGHRAFAEGIAAADPHLRHAWALIVDLARIGGVDLAAQSAGAAPDGEARA